MDSEMKMEIEMMREFVNNNKYPSYDECVKIITTPDGIRDGLIMGMYSEYGEYIHHLYKEMYYNFDEKSILQEAGKTINENGGFTAMQMSLYGFLKIMIHLVKNCGKKYTDHQRIIVTKHIFNTIQVKWDGIGEWKY